MDHPDLFHEVEGTIVDAIYRCAQVDRFNGGGRASMTAWESFEKYHNERPWIFTAFRRFTHEIIETGAEHFSSMAVVDRMRWESLIMLGNKDEYKISNTSHPFYARLFMELEAQHQGFFRIKNKPLTGIVKATKENDYDIG